jgi:predicted alpha/beta-fold hydrolase
MLRARLTLPLHRERLELPDGDFLDLDSAYRPLPSNGEEHGPLVLLLHGLEGSARSGYALQIYRELHARGIAAVGLNFRSCSGELNRLPRLYHSGETDDLRWVLGMLARRYPARRLGAIGVSLGGNVLLKYLGETGHAAGCPIEAAVAISVPFDLSAGADALLSPGGRFYTAHLLRGLRGKVVAKRELLPPEVDLPRALRARAFREFDDAATAPLHGFRSAEDYYRRCSSAGYLRRIGLPTLLLHARDDPFLPPAKIPQHAVETNPALTAAFTDRGGHIGFVACGSRFRPFFWAEREAARFIATHLLRSASKKSSLT